jgi:hypothetical protein
VLLLVAAVLVAALSGGQSALADNPKDDPAVEQASYSTGKAGSRLKWLARRTRAAKADPGPSATGAQYDTRNDTSRGLSCGAQALQDDQPSSRSWSRSLGDTRPPEKLGEEPPNTSRGKKSGGTEALLEKELVPRRHAAEGKCPSPKDMKHIGDLGTDINPPPPPPNWTEDNRGLPIDCPLGDDVFRPRCFAPITYTWTASALCHKPLYFEDVQLERYGHMAGPWLQPFASAANFFCTIPILPYKMGLESPNECMYTLGYYRPGSCAPYLFDPLPISVRGMFYEAGAWTAACFIFP